MQLPPTPDDSLSEDDISVKYITPAIVGAGWDETTQIGRQVEASTLACENQRRSLLEVLLYDSLMPANALEQTE